MLPCLAKPREQEILLQFFVILLYEMADDVRRTRQNRAIKRLFLRQQTEVVVVDEENTVEHSVLAHQVFCRRDLLVFVFFFLLFGLLLSEGQGREQACACAGSLAKETAAVR